MRSRPGSGPSSTASRPESQCNRDSQGVELLSEQPVETGVGGDLTRSRNNARRNDGCNGGLRNRGSTQPRQPINKPGRPPPPHPALLRRPCPGSRHHPRRSPSPQPHPQTPWPRRSSPAADATPNHAVPYRYIRTRRTSAKPHTIKVHVLEREPAQASQAPHPQAPHPQAQEAAQRSILHSRGESLWRRLPSTPVRTPRSDQSPSYPETGSISVEAQSTPFP